MIYCSFVLVGFRGVGGSECRMVGDRVGLGLVGLGLVGCATGGSTELGTEHMAGSSILDDSLSSDGLDTPRSDVVGDGPAMPSEVEEGLPRLLEKILMGLWKPLDGW